MQSLRASTINLGVRQRHLTCPHAGVESNEGPSVLGLKPGTFSWARRSLPVYAAPPLSRNHLPSGPVTQRCQPSASFRTTAFCLQRDEQFRDQNEGSELRSSQLPDDDCSLVPSPKPPPRTSVLMHAPILLLAILMLCSCITLFNPAVSIASVVEGSGTQSIAKSSLGIKVASWLRSVAGGTLSDEAIVVLVAALPVIELRGALPVAFWMGMDPLKASLLAILGNMIPVPFILAGLGPLYEALTAFSASAKKGLDWVLNYTRKKAGPIAEFQALGLMLFVAVPLPGTGAWSGAIAAYILKLPFWEAFWANFFGVVLAGAIVSALCLLGVREALLLAAGLFVLSGIMWSGLRAVLPKRT